MSIVSGIVLFAMIWTIVFFVLLPLGLTSQSEAGKVEPGTPASAPTDAMILRKALIATGITVVLFSVVFSVIQFRLVTLDDIPFLKLPAKY